MGLSTETPAPSRLVSSGSLHEAEGACRPDASWASLPGKSALASMMDRGAHGMLQIVSRGSPGVGKVHDHSQAQTRGLYTFSMMRLLCIRHLALEVSPFSMVSY